MIFVSKRELIGLKESRRNKRRRVATNDKWQPGRAGKEVALRRYSQTRSRRSAELVHVLNRTSERVGCRQVAGRGGYRNPREAFAASNNDRG